MNNPPRSVRLTLIAGCLSLLVASPAAGVESRVIAHAADRNCSDFSNQAEAQRYYVAKGGPGSDPDGLDAVGDGRACQTLPCPCSSGTGGGRDAPPRKRAQVISARITSVTDGDTVKLRAFGAKRRSYTVRILGIDTPEVFGGAECGGAAASRSMKRLAMRGGRGRRVTLTTDPTQDLFDRYGRLLAYAKTSTAQLNVAQVRRGWAKVYVYGGKRFRQYKRVARAQRAARRADRGVWGKCGGNFDRAVRARESGPTVAASIRYRRCGDLVKSGAGSYNVRAYKVRCRKARRVARQWERECASQPDGSCWVSAGFYCRYPDAGYELGRIRCTRGARVVKFVTGA